ncbi:condensation domain-containing protein [Nocardia thailandica]
MVDFGFLEDWKPAPGRVVAWTAAPQSRDAMAAAPAHSVPPSYQQAEYLRTAHRTGGGAARASRLCMISFDIPAAPDVAALGRAFTAFVRRHDTFHSSFRLDGEQVVRHVLDPALIELTATDHGHFQDPALLREFVAAGTPDARTWDCCGFGIIDRGNEFTVFAAVDHLHTDGVGQALTCVDLITRYGSELAPAPIPAPPVDGHIAYCARERAANAALTATSPAVATWLELLGAHGGTMPTFALPLGTADHDGFAEGAQLTFPLLTGADAARFDEVCATHGGRFLGGLFAALALTEFECTGAERYFVLTPVNTRDGDREAAAIGWYTNLAPVAVDVTAADSFATLVGPAQDAADRAREFTEVSPHRVVELAGPEHGLRVRPGWAAMMLSYVDVRRIDGVEMFDRINGGLFGNRAAADQVYLWVNRFPDVVTLSCVFPDTATAHASVERYVKTLTAIVGAVAAEGDRAAVVSP